MLQFYFLSVFTNLLAGITLTSEFLSKKFSAFAPFQDLFGKRGVKGSIGGLALVVGFLKLLIRSQQSDVPVAGDLLPALIGMGMGAALLFDMIEDRSEIETPPESMKGLKKVVVAYRVPLGIAGLVIGFLHFLLPGALFL